MWTPEVGACAIISGHAKRWRELGIAYANRNELEGMIVRIARETPTLLVDSKDRKWRKKDLGGVGDLDGYRLRNPAMMLHKNWSALTTELRKVTDPYRYYNESEYVRMARELR